MKRKLTPTKLNLFIASAVVLLVVGLVVEGMVTKPRQYEIEDLLVEKERLHAELERQQNLEADSREMAALLGIDSLDELEVGSQPDAVAYISELLTDAKLVRLALTTSGQEDAGVLRATSYTLRAKGGFRGMQDFVQKVEDGERLASIDDFRILPEIDSKSLEGRFNLTIYDLREER